MAATSKLTENDILERVIRPDVADLHPEAAQSFLELKFDRESTKHIRELLRKNNRGKISAEERVALDKYLRVGQFLDLMRAKAKLSIQRSGVAK
jgi:hypothetical protein